MSIVNAIAYESSEWVITIIPFLIFWTVRSKKLDSSFSPKNTILLFVFALYIIGVFYVTGAGTIYDAISLRPKYIGDHINLIPFSQEISIKGYILNIVLFMPFGFLAPILWKNMRAPISVILYGFAFSLLIEISQILSSRGTDIDDIILNTLGAAVGLFFYHVLVKMTNSKYQNNDRAIMTFPSTLLVLFLGRFFLLYRMGLIHLFFG